MSQNIQGEIYLSVLADVFSNPDYILDDVGAHPNMKGSREKINYSFTTPSPAREPVITGVSSRDDTVTRYTMQERERFDSGDITKLGEISSFWEQIRNPDGTINANYGHMIYKLIDAGNIGYNPDQGLVSQWQWAKSRLLLRRDTAQAVMHFNRPKDQWDGNLDQPCCMYTQFLIRGDKLHYNVNMRSNDLWFGTPYNLAYHIELMYRMRDELRPKYELDIGDLHYFAASLHIYNRHAQKVTEMIRPGQP